jgi:hypothetical protein
MAKLKGYYISFSSDEKFEGGVFTEAFSKNDAYKRCIFNLKLINPEGIEALILKAPAGTPSIPARFRDKLLTKEQVQEVDFYMFDLCSRLFPFSIH